MFARYAYPPNALGYCGPAGAETLLGHDPGASAAAVAVHAQQFEGAWHYLEILADALGRSDPLDPEVVEAYWIGNASLDKVEPQRLVAELQRRLPGQVGGSWKGAGHRATAHHGFHVFEVYPWVGLLGNNSPVPLSVLDQCRIRWAEVESVNEDHAAVRSQPLVFDDAGLSLGPVQSERVRWAENGRSFTDVLSPGDGVALHWDWVCDRLDARQSATLARLTQGQLTLVNTEVLGISPEPARH